MNARWNRTRVAVAVALSAGIGAAVVASIATAGSPTASSFVPMTPCRLLDTRPGVDNVGPRSVPLGPGTTFTVDSWGTNGNCVIPSGATALSLNVIAVGPTAASYLTVFPAGASRPTASSLNWVAGQAPTPNAVTASLSSAGRLSFFNLSGNVDIAVDVVGYYELASSGPAGPPGPAGPAGSAGPDPTRIIWVAESGGDFTSVSAALASITDNDATHRYVVRVAPGTYAENAGIDLKDYVDLEGSGPTTVITSTGTGNLGAAVRITGAKHTELRNLAVASTGLIGIAITSTTTAGDVRVTDVRAGSSGASNPQAVYLDGGVARLTRVEASVGGSAATKYGISAGQNSTVVVDDTSITITTAVASVDCVAATFDNSQVTITDMTVNIAGCGNYSIGLRASWSSVTADRVAITSTGATGAVVEGVALTTSTATIDRLTALAGGSGTTGTGLFAGSSTVLVRDSSLTGPTTSAARTGGVTKLWDSVVNGATSGMSGNCVNVVDVGLSPYTCI